jgi:hypothetical protein
MVEERRQNIGDRRQHTGDRGREKTGDRTQGIVESKKTA